jgi:F-type H+-transporting ATPase subunit a
MFIVVSNFTGLVNLRPPTADITTTLVFSISTFILIHATAIKKVPKAYFKSYLEPFFIMAPINVMGELAVIVSLAVRMFGNILSGVMIVSVIYYLLPWWLTIALPSVFHGYFDIFSGAMQAFIFTMLSMTLIRLKI